MCCAQGNFSGIMHITIEKRTLLAVQKRRERLCATFTTMSIVLVDTAHLHPVPELVRRGVPILSNLDPIIKAALRDPSRMGKRHMWKEVDDIKYLETLRDNVLRGDFDPVTNITSDNTFPSSGKPLTACAIKKRRLKLITFFRNDPTLLLAAHLCPSNDLRTAVYLRFCATHASTIPMAHP
jgi:hypothetical protein